MINRWFKVSSLIAVVVSGVLAIITLIMPVGQEFSVGPYEVLISRALFFLGRQVTIQDATLPVIIIVYGGAALWIGWGYLAHAPRIFPGIGLGVSALLIAALTVEPFLYAAMVIELIALAFVPLLVRPGYTAGKGVLRFITFLTLGMPFLLLAGWMLTGNSIRANQFELSGLAGILLGIGFIFLLAIFPFHSWVPMVMEEANPFSAAFVVFFISQASLFFAQGLTQRYDWISQSPEFDLAIRAAGVLMIVMNGYFLAFQGHLGRIFGFFVLAESGYALLAIVNPFGTSMQTFYGLAIVRVVTFSMMAYCLAAISRFHHSLSFAGLTGRYHSTPWLFSGVIVGQFCLVGLPLLAGFPVKVVLFQQFSGQNVFFYGSVLVGIAGALIIALRSLSVFVARMQIDQEVTTEPWIRKLPVFLGLAFLLLFGILPGITLSFLIMIIQ